MPPQIGCSRQSGLPRIECLLTSNRICRISTGSQRESALGGPLLLRLGQKQLPDTGASFSLSLVGRAGEGDVEESGRNVSSPPSPNLPRRGKGVQSEVARLFLTTS